MTRKKSKEGLQVRPSPSPATSRKRKQVPAKVNSAAASEKPEKGQRVTRKKSKEGLRVRPSPTPVKSRMKKQVAEKPERVLRMTRRKAKEGLMKFIQDKEIGVITEKRKRKGIKAGSKKIKLSVGAGSVSQSQKNVEKIDPQPEGEIPAAPVESGSSGPSERSQDDPPSLTRRKSQEEMFDELKRFTPRRMNLLRRFTEVAAKSGEGGRDSTDSPVVAGKVCQTCRAPQVEGRKKLRSCSVCSAVAYCDKECQRKDWPNHQKECWVMPGPGYKPKKHLQTVELDDEVVDEVVDEDMVKELNKEVVKKLCEDSYLINMMMVMVVEVIMKLKVIMLAGQGGCKILSGLVYPSPSPFVKESKFC